MTEPNNGHGHAHVHVAPLWIYFAVFAALLVLTGCTILVAYAPLGGWHTPMAVAIAVVKASLIVYFFMHGYESSKLVWLTLGGSLFTLSLLFLFTFADYWTRDFDESIRRAVPVTAVKRPYP
jgi:cytochrome c oxidase subunit 4